MLQATSLLKGKNVYTHMETDHYHYAERGGENYWANFTSWNLHRGTENDTIYWGPEKAGIPCAKRPEGYVGVFKSSYESSKRQYEENPERYSTPRTFSAAADWLERYKEADNFLLWVEAFDPHEPFDVPREYLDMYQSEKEDPDCYWPKYETSDNYTSEQIAGFRKRYKALLTMTDDYLGKLLDVLDRNNLWEDTMVILTTDHGYLLGEHGFMAKNIMPDYNEIFHIPMMIYMPGVESGRCKALTQSVDIFPTILELFNVPLSNCKNQIHGRSIIPLLKGKENSIRKTALFGYFGKTVNITDGNYVYMRRHTGEANEPLNMYVAMPTILNQYIGYDSMDESGIEQITMANLSWNRFPVYKVPAHLIDWQNSLRVQDINRHIPHSLLFDLKGDYFQNNPLDNKELESYYVALLRQSMEDHDSPKEQFERLGLNDV